MRITKFLHVTGVLAAALAAGHFMSTPAFADNQSDVTACFSGSDTQAAARITACTRVIESGKVNQRDLAGAYNWRGESYRLLKQYDLALADYARSIQINPDSVYPYANRAEVYRMQGKYDLVVADATEAIRIDPALNASYTIRGMAYEKLNDLDHARADFNKALELPIKGNDGKWAQDVARNHLQSIGGGNGGGANNAGTNNPGASTSNPGQTRGGGLMNDDSNNSAQNPGGGTTSGGNILMNR
jgi:tetratricopeptide (TPR) repeat protein